MKVHSASKHEQYQLRGQRHYISRPFSLTNALSHRGYQPPCWQTAAQNSWVNYLKTPRTPSNWSISGQQHTTFRKMGCRTIWLNATRKLTSLNRLTTTGLGRRRVAAHESVKYPYQQLEIDIFISLVLWRYQPGPTAFDRPSPLPRNLKYTTAPFTHEEALPQSISALREKADKKLVAVQRRCKHQRGQCFCTTGSFKVGQCMYSDRLW